MKSIRNFFLDFFRTFIEFALHAIYITFDIIVLAFQIFLTNFTRIMNEKIYPFFIELLADINLFLNVILQGLYSMLSDLFLFLSKSSFKLSEIFHKKSESIIHKKWEVN